MLPQSRFLGPSVSSSCYRPVAFVHKRSEWSLNERKPSLMYSSTFAFRHYQGAPPWNGGKLSTADLSERTYKPPTQPPPSRITGTVSECMCIAVACNRTALLVSWMDRRNTDLQSLVERRKRPRTDVLREMRLFQTQDTCGIAVACPRRQ
jgi:hypothetical protein